MLGSSWSLATTAFDLETDSDQPDNANEKTSHNLEQTCWRRPEVARIGSPEIIRCLSNFGLCSGAFASEAGVNVPSPKTHETLSFLAWTWRPYSAQTLDAERIASELTFESQEYFRLVRFEDWVRETIRISPSSAVGSLEAKYNRLSSNLYYYLRRHPEECEKYLDVKRILEKESDPFLFQAIGNASDCVSERKYSDIRIDARFITEPIKKILDHDKPIQLILHQLEALAVRFQNWYGSPEVDWLQDFDTQTDFLDNLYCIKPRNLAVQLSKADASIFWELDVHAITEGSGSVLSTLNTRWNSLCCAVKECSSAGDGFDKKLVELVKVLCRLCNFFSLTAVLQGIRSSGRHIPALQEFDYLIDSEKNYLLYRQNMSADPALHFLFPFIRIGKPEIASRILSAARNFTVRDEQRINFVSFLCCPGLFR
ncbi:hypothetical protein CNMCM5878_005655 [Aspergillus fumigatiaffinis]|nr:hypothetical protein CNMCM5878_005655 [Aspergillus fumigatiaffinis]